jgi:hypothetical protein
MERSPQAGEVGRAIQRHNAEVKTQQPHLQIARQMIPNAKKLAMLPKLRQDAGSVQVLSELLKALT